MFGPSNNNLNLSLVDVLEFLDKLGIENVTDDGIEARFSCPYPAHGFGDKSPSAYMNLETTAFVCFSCSAQGNAITFLADVKSISRFDAKNFIAQKWEPKFAKIENLREHVEQMLAGQQKAYEVEHTEFVPLREDTIGVAIKAVDWQDYYGMWNFAGGAPEWANYMFDRGFTGEILNRFGFVYDSIYDRPCITVRTQDGGLVGFKGRAWKEDQFIKYIVSGDTPRTIEQYGVRFGFEPYDASHFVFGAHIAKPIDGRLVLIEGEFNVVSAHQKGVSNAVGPSGSTLSDIQVQEIARMCDEITIFFDTDAHDPVQYATAQLKILKAVRAFEPLVSVRVVGDHVGDPAEMKSEEIHRLIEEAQWSTRWRVEQGLRTAS